MSAVLRTVLQRLGLGVLTLFVVSVIIFSTIEMLPGNFARAILGQSATPETVAAFQREIGLDRSPVERYLAWVGGVVPGASSRGSGAGVGSGTVASVGSPGRRSSLTPELSHTDPSVAPGRAASRPGGCREMTLRLPPGAPFWVPREYSGRSAIRQLGRHPRRCPMRLGACG